MKKKQNKDKLLRQSFTCTDPEYAEISRISAKKEMSASSLIRKILLKKHMRPISDTSYGDRAHVHLASDDE